MPRPTHKGGADAPAPSEDSDESASYLPDDEETVSKIPFKSPKTGRTFTIRRTKEQDAYNIKKRRRKGDGPEKDD
jgi:hypothetical protein